MKRPSLKPEQTALADYRIAADLTYEQLAEQIGRSVTWLHQFMRSDRPRANARSLNRVRLFLTSVQPAGKARKRVAA